MTPAANRPWFQSLREISDLPSCIIVPSGTEHQWEFEARRLFTSPPLSIHTPDGMTMLATHIQAVKDEEHGKRCNHLLILKQGLLKLLYERGKANRTITDADRGPASQPQDSASDLFMMRFLCMYVDEAHYCRNPGNLFSAVEALAKHSAVRLGMTATPLPTGPKDLLLQARALQMHDCVTQVDGVSKDIQQAIGRARKAGGFYSEEGWAELSPHVDLIRDLLLPSMLRRTTTSCDYEGRPLVDLPALVVETVYIDMKEHERDAVRQRGGLLEQIGSAMCRNQVCNGMPQLDVGVSPHRLQAFGTAARRALTHVRFTEEIEDSEIRQPKQPADKQGVEPPANEEDEEPTANRQGQEQLATTPVTPNSEKPDPTPSSKLEYIVQKIKDIFKEDEEAGLTSENRRKVLVCSEWPSMNPIIEAVRSILPSCTTTSDLLTYRH